MKTRKKLLSLALCLALILSALPAALGEADGEARHTRRLRLGSSVYTVEVDSSFAYGEVSEEARAMGQAACLLSDVAAVDIDIYQFVAPDGQEVLADYVAEEASLYGGEGEVVTDGEINGIPAGWYRTVEEHAGMTFQTVTYILADRDEYVELVFWLEGEAAEAEAKAIVDSLAVDELSTICLGSSPYRIECSTTFEEGGMTSEDVADGQVAYWKSDALQLDFDVYQFSKEGYPASLEAYAAEEAAEYDGAEGMRVVPINGIPVAAYRTVEEYEGKAYNTVTCVLDAGEDYVEIVFWLDGGNAEAEADAIIQSLWMEEVEEAEEAEATEAAEETVEAPEAEGIERVEASVAEAPEQAQEAGDEALEEVTEEDIEALMASIEETSGEEEEADEVYAEGIVVTEDEEEPAEGESVEDEYEAEYAVDESDESAYDEEDYVAEDYTEDEADAAEAGDGVYTLRLGASSYRLLVPADYAAGDMTPEDISDDQVGYFYSHERLLDFDVYQFTKAGYPEVLADYAAMEAEGYNDVTELVLDGEINGIPACWYRTIEEYESERYDTLTYILDDGDEYVEVVFWLDGVDAEKQAEDIINTLSREDEGDAVLLEVEETYSEADPTAEAPEMALEAEEEAEALTDGAE